MNRSVNLMRSVQIRRGVTLMEVLVVMVILIVLGAIAVPTIRSLSGNTKTQAGADMVRGRIARGRASAMEQGVPHSVVVSPDGTQIRVKVAEEYSASAQPAAPTVSSANSLPGDVLLQVLSMPTMDAEAPMMDSDGWIRFVTFMPDGTCSEGAAAVRISEPGQTPMMVRVRGLTGACEVAPEAAQY
jgi:prepilin-type N-terminal cleavage/methylation domain-containing protein